MKPPLRPAAWMRAHWALVVPLAVYVVLFLPWLGYADIFDGNAYLECLQHAANEASLRFSSLFCYKHPTLLLSLPYVLALKISGGSLYAFNAVTILLGACGVAAVHSLLRLLLPREEKITYMLMTMLYALHPVILAVTLNFTPDTGLLIMTMILLACLFRQRYVAATLAGLLLTFSKEPGIVLYVVATCMWLVVSMCRSGHTRQQIISHLDRAFTLMLPVAGFAVYLALKWYTLGYPPVTDSSQRMMAVMQGETYKYFFRIDLLDPAFVARMANLFVLNFSWIPALIIAAAAVLCVTRFAIGSARKHKDHVIDLRASAVVLALTVFTIYFLTRFPTSNNLRYLGPAYPLVALLFCIALRSTMPRAAVRNGILAIVVFLQAVSIFRTIDPVSKHVAGTFRFGSHDILAIGTASHDGCCGYGRDQLLYSPEFMTAIRELQDQAYRWIQPTPSTVIALDWWMVAADKINPVTGGLATSLDTAITPRYVSTRDTHIFASADAPAEVYFPHYPDYMNDEQFLAVSRFYDDAERRTFEWNGYELAVSRMVRKDTAR
jgi:hypothetical protein